MKDTVAICIQGSRGHVPDDLILEACRKGPFVFKGHAQKRSAMKM